MKKHNIGILASISWNSNQWKEECTEADAINSNYEFVQEKGYMEEAFNFATQDLPTEADGFYIGSTPMFDSPPSLEESKYVDIVFFRSLDYHTARNLIVGFYAFPIIGQVRRATAPKGLMQYIKGNLRAKPENILLLNNPLQITNDIVVKNKFLPQGKQIGQRNFNYLFFDNVVNILDKSSLLNSNDERIKRIKFKFLTEKKYQSLK